MRRGDFRADIPVELISTDDWTAHQLIAQNYRIGRVFLAGVSAEELAYDVMMRNVGSGMIYMALANYGSGSFTPLRGLIGRPGLIAGLSDAGAHCLRVVDASAPTFMLAHWARDRSRGEKLPIELIV